MNDLAQRKSTAGRTKGRDVDETTVRSLQSLLGHEPIERDRLIECLHAIQDAKGAISADEICALAHLMKLSQSEVYETATFYAHFHVTKERQSPQLTVRLCDGPACQMHGAKAFGRDVATALGDLARVVEVACVGQCDKPPAAHVGKTIITHATLERVSDAVSDTAAQASSSSASASPSPSPSTSNEGLADYLDQGGYGAFGRLARGEMDRNHVLSELEAADLKGMGGAGFPVAKKWRFLDNQPKERVVVVNADEGEPGTFKDRHILHRTPHAVLEGALIAAHTVEAQDVYIYLRDEYPDIHEMLSTELRAIAAHGIAPDIRIHLRRGAGAYVCGEETALLESLEGRRGMPRNRPPFPAQSGLFGRPTLINNVETLYWVRQIVTDGSAAYLQAGRPHFYSVSGRVRDPGVKLAPSGVTARQLIHDYAGGMAAGHTFKAYLPGGASGGILPARLGDLPLDFGTLEPYGCFVGSSAVIVLSDQDDLMELVRNLIDFFAHESCGQCTPCRSGIPKLGQLLNEAGSNRDLIEDIAQVMRDGSICGLGQAAPNPVLCALNHFDDDRPA